MYDICSVRKSSRIIHVSREELLMTQFVDVYSRTFRFRKQTKFFVSFSLTNPRVFPVATREEWVSIIPHPVKLQLPEQCSEYEYWV